MRIPIVNNIEPFSCLNDELTYFEPGEDEWLEHQCCTYAWQDGTYVTLFEHARTRQITLDQRIPGYSGYIDLLGALSYTVSDEIYDVYDAPFGERDDGEYEESDQPVVEATPWIVKSPRGSASRLSVKR